MQFYLLGLCLLISIGAESQVVLKNYSFEGEPREATVPHGWDPCAEGTTPDILPGPWEVTTLPSDGKTYMGLIIRQDGSWESVGQALPNQLPAGNCFTFSVNLAHSDTYAGYNLPLRLKIWGGRSPCQKSQLIGETPAVDHVEWRTYSFRFFTEQPISYLILEAQMAPGIYFSYNGNILIDACAPLDLCKRASIY